MPASRLYPADCKSAATMQRERLRIYAELAEVIAGAKRTIAHSRALLAEVDTVLAKAKLPLLAEHLFSFDANR